ncbi:CYTH domain-containing protein [Lentibacillus sediminis]|uniref:CYTH domain-containing protein n=1 Tax=Lentibacillus sediminis TaxID=1940529 RepID=UPI000C1BA08A|nr:CYTH domain-containing protein [Lentibacillus sediminis]
MTQEIEIEYKNLLTKQEFDRLLHGIPFPEHGKTQTNYYFETNDFQLKAHGSALRIREKNGDFRLTLKQPHPDGLLETHDELTEDEARKWLDGQISSKSNTEKQLWELGISPGDLLLYGSLKTERRETSPSDQVLLVLDYSTYNGQFDFELELEATSAAAGKQAFQSLLKTYNIPERETPNKIKRFFFSLEDSSR